LIDIEIFSDIICPWCFIGKQRLDKVLATDVGEGVRVRWRPYQLYPQIPLEGRSRVEFLQQRYGADAELGRVPERIAVEAAAEGIALRYDLIERTPNTLLAHRLMELAAAFDCQHQMAQALFEAYFCHGDDVGDAPTLVAIATRCGLEAQTVAAFLASEDAVQAVQAQLARAVDIGVSGVPGFYLANAFLLPGAQTAETMAQIITRVKSRLA